MSIFNKKRLLRTKLITKTLDEMMPHEHLAKSLTAMDLTLLGIGAIIGAGIFILTGVAAATQAGPGIALSFVFASIACLFSALSYAELASSIGGCGSAYGYAYAGFGEIFAWLIGWDLILEYGVAVAAVAVGWSAYTNDILTTIGIHLPMNLTKGIFQHGFINLPAVIIVLLITVLLSLGAKTSARFNSIIVFVKVAVIFLFVAVAFPHIDFSHWQPFLPFGWQGIINGASLIFFAYIGFDAVSTAAEEAKNPQRDMPRGIIASLIICTLIYVVVASVLTLVVPYHTLNVESPVANVLLRLGYHATASIIAVGAVAGLTTVMLVMYYGLSRVSLAMSRDRLLPHRLAVISQHTKTPTRIIFIAGVIIATIAGILPITTIAEMVNIGTLAAFVFVNIGTIVLRKTQPDLHRPFKVPGGYLTPSLGIIFCLYLMLHLPWVTWMRFFGWMLLGLIIYSYQLFKQDMREKKAKDSAHNTEENSSNG